MTLKGAIVVVLDDQDRVLLGKRPLNKAFWMPGKWAFPGGKIEEGEAPIDAAIRETKEEMNLDVENLKELKTTLDKAVAIYYTRKYHGNVQIDHEHTDWAWVPRADLPNYDLAPHVGEIYRLVLKNEH